MHPRVRSIAASFLCFDLGVDWRVGLEEWDRHLIEDDPALAIGNWQWVAGVGADLAAYPRIYNPQKQARRFDPSGVYARRWIQELAHLPAGADLMRASTAQIELPLYSGRSDPAPVIDHDRAAREFLAAYQRFTQAFDRRANH
jgi:deoxyribodipyrimidine photo-lyase